MFLVQPDFKNVRGIQSLSTSALFSITHQEQQVVVCQLLQQQQQRELQRLALSGALPSTPNSPKIAQSPSLLSSTTASPKQGSQGGSLFGLQDNTLHKPGVSNRHRITCSAASCVAKDRRCCVTLFRLRERRVETEMGENWFDWHGILIIAAYLNCS